MYMVVIEINTFKAADLDISMTLTDTLTRRR